MMRPESAIDLNSPCISVSRDFQTNFQLSFGVQIEMVGELWGFPCLTWRNLSLHSQL